MKQHRQIKIDRSDLMAVTSPARYLGGEVNRVLKQDVIEDLNTKGYTDKVRVAFCFPDVYEIGMSNLALQILYKVMNDMSCCYCERVFSPWHDMDKIMRDKKIPLYSLETYSPLDEFDTVMFTLGYEMCYTNVLQVMDLGGIPLRQKDRTEEDPLIIVGGVCAYNIEPMADFVDIALLGEGEEVNVELIEAIKKYKDSGKKDKMEFLREVSKIPGIYVPCLYEPVYEDNKYLGLKKLYSEAPDSIRKRIISDMDTASYPTKPVISNMRVVHDRAYLEIFRGCIRGCRFCQAGYIYRPVREKSVDLLCKQGIEIERNTGFDELGVLSLSTSDYTGLEELTTRLLDAYEGRHTSLSVPSLRIDNFALDLMDKVSQTRKSGLTFAPEAGTQRLRDVINKGINEEDIMSSLRLAFENGWNTVKLYFMLGLPTETMEDVKGIADLAYKIEKLYFDIGREKNIKMRWPEITVSTSLFIPKPFTAFQWEQQCTLEEFHEKQSYLRSLIKSRNIKYNWHDFESTIWEGILARADRRLGDVIEEGYRTGHIYDAWDESFKYEDWMEILKKHNLSWEMYARDYNVDSVLPWDHIDIGVTRDFLLKERQKAYEEVVTPNCREKCSLCGATCFKTGVCYEKR